MEKHILPADIERTSMAIISRELKERGIALPAENAAVIQRVIHATADFDYVENLVFTEHAVERGVVALSQGVPILTDTNMALAGISKPARSRLHVEAACYMADADIAAAAKEQGTTRAVACVKKGALLHPEAIFAVGNAPTALLALCELIEEGLRPSLVIGVPVGFVNVVDSKEKIFAVCEKYKVPAIVALGRKGGSTVAAAICNALLYAAADMINPTNRGWQG